ncbi:hypothetical protein GTQ99_00575 [Kineococcus sp. T13]|uniref:hypothetical protein n=1 Tax=Kineococcus vitellinus TaxID=2696565 RepID=UPI001411E6A5|nr:hypothetical protein [Kineococcus vitellinus]NAZ73926.1 hypothetical protein [Kineococcus vitellinus]
MNLDPRKSALAARISERLAEHRRVGPIVAEARRLDIDVQRASWNEEPVPGELEQVTQNRDDYLVFHRTDLEQFRDMRDIYEQIDAVTPASMPTTTVAAKHVVDREPHRLDHRFGGGMQL